MISKIACASFSQGTVDTCITSSSAMELDRRIPKVRPSLETGSAGRIFARVFGHHAEQPRELTPRPECVSVDLPPASPNWPATRGSSVEQAMNHPQLRARRGRVDDFDIDALHVTGSREVVASPDCIGAGLPRFDQRDDVRLVAGCAGHQPLPTPGGLLAVTLVRSAILP
jgi:hypothetical protein